MQVQSINEYYLSIEFALLCQTQFNVNINSYVYTYILRKRFSGKITETEWSKQQANEIFIGHN